MPSRIFLLCLMFFLCFSFITASSGLAQGAADTASASSPSTDELLVRGKKIFVTTNSFYEKKEQLQSGLVNRKDLRAWGYQVVTSQRDADLVLTVLRVPFRSKFPFTFTDQQTGIVVFGGSVYSPLTPLGGTVGSRIAWRFAHRLKGVYKTKQP